MLLLCCFIHKDYHIKHNHTHPLVDSMEYSLLLFIIYQKLSFLYNFYIILDLQKNQDIFHNMLTPHYIGLFIPFHTHIYMCDVYIRMHPSMHIYMCGTYIRLHPSTHIYVCDAYIHSIQLRIFMCVMRIYAFIQVCIFVCVMHIYACIQVCIFMCVMCIYVCMQLYILTCQLF